MAQKPLCVTPEMRRFSSEQEGEFRKILELQDKHTVLSPLDSVQQVTLDVECRTVQGKLQLSSLAFRQLCRIAAAGLASLVLDIAGLRRRKENWENDRFSQLDSLHIFNTVMKRRFTACLEGFQTVRDTRTGVIDGIVGRNYRRLPNFDLIQKAEEVLKLYRLPVKFLEGSLAGRYMSLSHRSLSPIFSVEAPRQSDDFYSGFHFGNSEIGDGSVRAVPMLLRELDDGKSLGNFSQGGRLVHAGKDFHRRFEMLLNKVAERQMPVAEIRERTLKIREKKLGFTGIADQDEKRFDELVRLMQSKGLTISIAKRSIQSALLQDSYMDAPISDFRFLKPTERAARTYYDLYNAMNRVAQTLSIASQERLQQLSYSLLLGRVNF